MGYRKDLASTPELCPHCTQCPYWKAESDRDSACKSSLGTAKKTRTGLDLDRIWTGNSQDQEKTVTVVWSSVFYHPEISKTD